MSNLFNTTHETYRVSVGTRVADWLCSKLSLFDKIIPLGFRSCKAQTDKALKQLEKQYVKSGFTITPELKEQCEKIAELVNKSSAFRVTPEHIEQYLVRNPGLATVKDLTILVKKFGEETRTKGELEKYGEVALGDLKLQKTTIAEHGKALTKLKGWQETYQWFHKHDYLGFFRVGYAITHGKFLGTKIKETSGKIRAQETAKQRVEQQAEKTTELINRLAKRSCMMINNREGARQGIHHDLRMLRSDRVAIDRQSGKIYRQDSKGHKWNEGTSFVSQRRLEDFIADMVPQSDSGSNGSRTLENCQKWVTDTIQWLNTANKADITPEVLGEIEANMRVLKAEVPGLDTKALQASLQDKYQIVVNDFRATIGAINLLGNPDRPLEIYDIPVQLAKLKAMLKNPELPDSVREELQFKIAGLEREGAIYAADNMNHLIGLFNQAIELAKHDFPDSGLDINPFQLVGGEQTISRDSFIKQAKAMQAQVENAFEKAGINFQPYYNRALNASERAWSAHSAMVTLLGPENTSVEFSCSLKPAKALGCFSYYDERTHGISSACRDSKHAINLWETEVKCGGETLFRGLRHGNTRGKQEATKEIVLAAAVQTYGLEFLQDAAREGGTKDHPVELRLANVQLLSPSFLSFGYDGKMPFQQMEALKKLARGGPIKIEIPGSKKPVYIKLERPLTFNFGCNLQHFNPIARKFLSGSDKQNLESMQQLFGKSLKSKTLRADHEKDEPVFDPDSLIGRYCQRTDVSPGDIKMVKQLAVQIVEMWQDGSYKTNASNPYAMSSRMSLLAYKLGYATTFNCKSGKDRTGVANAEIAGLATAFKMTGKIPEPYRTPSFLERANLSKLLDGTGANHVTQACTGVRGLKIVSALGFKSVAERFGSVVGASSSVKVKG